MFGFFRFFLFFFFVYWKTSFVYRLLFGCLASTKTMCINYHIVSSVHGMEEKFIYEWGFVGLFHIDVFVYCIYTFEWSVFDQQKPFGACNRREFSLITFGCSLRAIRRDTSAVRFIWPLKGCSVQSKINKTKPKNSFMETGGIDIRINNNLV